MATDKDLTALLPNAPPSRPAKREAAVDAALRRFDGHGDAPSVASSPPARPRQSWVRPQVAAFASAMLVVLVSVPVWWSQRDHILPAASRSVPTTTPAQLDAEPAPVAQPQSATTAPTSAAPSVAAAAEPPPSPSPDARDANLNRLPQFGPAQTPSPSEASANAFATSATNASQLPEAPAQRAAAAPPPAARAVGQAAGETPAEQADRSAVVVTGSRIARPDHTASSPVVAVTQEMLGEGGWNDCTVRDPRRNLAACRALADPAADGAAGRAGARLADGLTLAWQGDLDRAIAAFDRAIEADPGLAVAYLNRGLAWQEKGDLRRARTDLDRAVARDRDSAQAYYHRSLLHRARGDAARAENDARRAIERDSGYRAVLP